MPRWRPAPKKLEAAAALAGVLCVEVTAWEVLKKQIAGHDVTGPQVALAWACKRTDGRFQVCSHTEFKGKNDRMRVYLIEEPDGGEASLLSAV